MSPKVRAGMWRLLAARHRARAAECEMAAKAITAGAAIQSLVASVQAGEQREIADHPDLAYLNAQLDGFYEPLPQGRGET